MRALVIVLCGSMVPTLSAHEITVLSSRGTLAEPGKTTVYLAWGHRLPVDELIDGATIERYESIGPDSVKTAWKPEGVSLQAQSLVLKANGVHTVLVGRKPSVSVYVKDKGERVMKRGSKLDHAGAEIESSQRSRQSGKTLIVVGTPRDAAPKAVGLSSELTPLDGPARWQVGQVIRVQYLRDGQPLAAKADVRFISFGNEPSAETLTSNEQGEFRFTPKQAGVWQWKVNVKSPSAASDRAGFDDESTTTTLTFEVRP